MNADTYAVHTSEQRCHTSEKNDSYTTWPHDWPCLKVHKIKNIYPKILFIFYSRDHTKNSYCADFHYNRSSGSILNNLTKMREKLYFAPWSSVRSIKEPISRPLSIGWFSSSTSWFRSLKNLFFWFVDVFAFYHLHQWNLALQEN